MLRFVLAASVAAMVAGCSKAPDKIAAADIGPAGYERLGCKPLSAKRLEFSQKLETLTAEQKTAQQSDAIGVLLFGLPLGRMSGNDRETAIAVAKGHLNAIDTVRQSKSCG